jgi:N utilization substance protein B
MKTPANEPRPLAPRSAARLSAVQALYQMDLAETDLNNVIGQFTLHHFGEKAEDKSVAAADRDFFAAILRGVVRRQREIDPIVDAQLAEGWRLTRVDSTLRAILRAGVYELIERTDVPARVVISEYVEVAKAFFSEDEPRVVNGVLDKIARRTREAEFKPSGGD